MTIFYAERGDAMSIASVFMQQVISDKPAKHKMGLIEELFNWKDEDTPLCNMGVLLEGSAKDEYLEEIRERVREMVNSKSCSIETLFWLYYLAEILDFELPVTTHEEQTAKDFLDSYLKDPSKDIEEYVSTIKLD